MIIKASVRAALILATGIWIGLSGASQAETDTDNSTAVTSTAVTAAKHGTHHAKKSAQHKPSKVADTTANDKKVTASEDSNNPTPVQSSWMPASVANANARWASPDTPAGSAGAMTDPANNIPQVTPDDAQAAASTPVVAADQLNDVDRALHESVPAAAPVVMASADAPAVVASPPATVANPGSESSIWDHTSLIGKIFIGFGALLTMASAARMFMA